MYGLPPFDAWRRLARKETKISEDQSEIDGYGLGAGGGSELQQNVRNNLFNSHILSTTS